MPRVAGVKTAVLEWDLDRIAGGGITAVAADQICRSALMCGSIAFLVGRYGIQPQCSSDEPGTDQILQPYRGPLSLWLRLCGRTPPRIVLSSHVATVRGAFESTWWAQGGQALAMFNGAPRLSLLTQLDWKRFAQGEFTRCAPAFARAGAWCLAAPGPDGAYLAVSVLESSGWDTFQRHAGLLNNSDNLS